MTEVELLERLSQSVGSEFDPLVARQATRQAAREYASEPTETCWPDRLSREARDVGLRVSRVTWTARQAIAHAGELGPVLGFMPGPADVPDSGRWVLLERRGWWGRRAWMTTGDGDGNDGRWVSAGELARIRGTTEPTLWAVVQPLLPCSGADDTPGDSLALEHQDHGSNGHGGGHGHDEMKPLTRLMKLLQPDRRDIRVVLAFAVAVGLLSLATPLAVETLVMTTMFNRLYQQLAVVAAILGVCLAVAAFLQGLQTYVVEYLQRRIFLRLVADLSYRLPRVSAEAYDRQYGPELVNRFFDVLTVQKVVSSLLTDGVSILLQTTVGLVLLGFYHPFLLGFNGVVAVSILFAVFVLGKGAIRTSIRESRSKYAVAATLEEMALWPLAFKSSGGLEFAMDRADAVGRRYLAARQDHFRILFRQIVFALGLQAIATTTLLGLGGWLVLQEKLTIGQLVAAELIVATVAASLTKLGKHIEGYYDLMAAVDKLGHLMDVPLERRDGEDLHHEGSAAGSALRLRDLGYSYPGSHHPAFAGLNLTVAPGERVAVVGPAGSGKSTLADLLFGLRPPTEGRIEIDGCDLRDLDLPLLRNRVAVVKCVEIVEGTLADNVRMGRDLSLWEVRRALEKVGLLDDVSELPDSLHTPLTITGSPLSRGQAQRLMLARAIAGRPRLVVIDQLLDSLSSKSMGTIYSTLFDRESPWTLVVMTHHPDVLRHCDRTISLPRRALAHHHHAGGNGHAHDDDHAGHHDGDAHAPDSDSFGI